MIEKLIDTLTIIVGIIVILCGILSILYIVSPQFERRVHNTAAEIGTGGK